MREVDGDVVIVVTQPSEYCAKEIVGIAHEVELEFAFQGRVEFLLFSRVCGVVNKIVNVGTNVDLLVGGLGISVTDDAGEEAQIV